MGSSYLPAWPANQVGFIGSEAQMRSKATGRRSGRHQYILLRQTRVVVLGFPKDPLWTASVQLASTGFSGGQLPASSGSSTKEDPGAPALTKMSAPESIAATAPATGVRADLLQGEAYHV
jgi:hypothetical protein